MGHFEDYVKNYRKGNKKKDLGFHKKMQSHSVADNDTPISDDPYEYENRLKSRLENSTFEERTAYYFSDAYLESKIDKYSSLCGDNEQKNRTQELNILARKYNNRSFKKRKKKARNASSKFADAKRKALELEANNNLDNYQLFEKREKILRLRMEGMIEAAKAKSQSDSHETYLCDRARLSCLMLIKDQLKNLWVKNISENKMHINSKFIQKQIGLNKELEDARYNLRIHTPTTLVRYLDENGYDEEHLAALTSIHMKTYKNQDNTTKVTYEGERTRVILNLIQKDSENVGFPQRILFKNSHGQRFAAGVNSAHKWNAAYNTAVRTGDEETQYKTIMGELDLIRRYELPPFETLISKKGMVGVLESDFGTIYRILKISVPHLIKVMKTGEGNIHLPGKQFDLVEYLQNNEWLKEKIGLFDHLDKQLNKDLLDCYGIKYDHKYGTRGQMQYVFVTDDRLKEKEDNKEKLSEKIEASCRKVQELSQNDNFILSNKKKESSAKSKGTKVKNSILSQKDSQHIMEYYKVNPQGTKELAFTYAGAVNISESIQKQYSNKEEQFKDAHERIKNFVLPSEQELEDRWLPGIISAFRDTITNPRNKTLSKWLGVIRRLRTVKSIQKEDKDIQSFIKSESMEDPMFTAKFKAICKLADYCRCRIMSEYGFDVGEYFDNPHPVSRASDEIKNAGMEIDRRKKDYLTWLKVDQKNKANKEGFEKKLRSDRVKMNKEVSKGEPGNTDLYRIFTGSNIVLYNPKYLARINNAQAKIRSKEMKGSQNFEFMTTKRAVGAMLLSESYESDETTGYTDTKRENLSDNVEWNDKWTRAWEDSDSKTISEMTMEGIDELLDFELPKARELEDGSWLNKLFPKKEGKDKKIKEDKKNAITEFYPIKDHSEQKARELLDKMRRICALSYLEAYVPELRKRIEKDSKLKNLIDAVRALRDFLAEAIKDDRNAGFDVILEQDDNAWGEETGAVYKFIDKTEINSNELTRILADQRRKNIKTKAIEQSKNFKKIKKSNLVSLYKKKYEEFTKDKDFIERKDKNAKVMKELDDENAGFVF